MLATRDVTLRLASPPIQAVSAVGAGDSFLGEMVHALAQGRSMVEAFAHGVAAGAAAAMTPGTEPCRRPDVQRLLAGLRRQLPA